MGTTTNLELVHEDLAKGCDRELASRPY